MQIRNTAENYYKPTFKHWERTVEKTNASGVKKIIHRNDTMTYRDHSWWRWFGEYINGFFKDSKKVNVYNWACSNGEESATFVMQMFSNFPDTAEKFTPVYAKDYDHVAIEKAKKHVLPLGLFEIYDINYYTKGKIDEFLRNVPDYYKRLVKMSGEALQNYAFRYQDIEPELTQTVYAKFNEKYAKYIDYEVSDITKDYKKINPKESLVIMRNFLPYLGEKKTYKLLENLSKQIQEKCVIAIGDFDTDTDILDRIKSLGFKWSGDVDGVYYKP